jgi:hypothetical protein
MYLNTLGDVVAVRELSLTDEQGKTVWFRFWLAYLNAFQIQ